MVVRPLFPSIFSARLSPEILNFFEERRRGVNTPPAIGAIVNFFATFAVKSSWRKRLET
jgi:hypothetical protein